ncbi:MULTISPECIES: DNA gyrase/topoisomerase IV subunit A [Sphingobacterium]|uniref:DNA gyrase/topoisomerase IV subunit A n=2 Tax=Sphingobacterium TaxID=28453 RepID=A0ABX7CID5_SPHMU|nr:MULTISPECIES: DNA gyrase/topoisomerase IV subunit A [Sphingobacterium]QQT32192.1 DNA gyrase/topoisomerase IV subunit A [Sphingobacterium multivorum]QQT51888.1 DNA gyrase/topoisomerase IV subunit A [Sphingobacterium multivorum]QRY56943.1 DNA gyrase/topoisomerase IV subunit A [Sphingobacterium siyangense]RKF29982.1 DNA topoisomerase IV [Sphingobacterium siyangense]
MSDETNFPTEDNQEELGSGKTENGSQTIPLSGLYENWFLDYASYVILDRAVPHINDGLKPVQRRILHSLKEMDDGRYNKAANVIGNTMKYHPHGDASIGDAMVQLGQKDLLIDCQGNWGFPITGDSAAAPRYIEGRLSKFANDVVFNPETTEWQLSYDGRNREPVTLPVKFPLLLAQGAEGIAVGLATKIMPHNFIELIDGSIQVLNGERPNIFPDFPTGGMADVSNYNEGQRGGKIRVRAKIEERDKKTLAITEIPFGTTTGGLIESVVTANDKGKIKIKKIEDNTAGNVEIIVHLAPGISPDVTIDALYAFTACEVSISPNTCVIKDEKPHFMSVNDILTENTINTKNLLKRELEIRLNDLQEKIFFSSLLKIFIQEGMYKHPDYENAGDFEVVVQVLNRLFEPFFDQFYREIRPEDYKKLIDKPMSSITRFDVKKADEMMKTLENEIKEVKRHLRQLTEYAIAWFEKLREKYSKDRERKTELRIFDKVEATQVALANAKLYVNREEGFIGSGMKKDKFVCDCSDIDDIIVFREDGKYVVSKIQDKVFVGKGIIHVAVFKKGDERTIYNAIYKEGETGTSYIKRFSVVGVTRDKEYDVSKGSKGSKILYFTANPNGEAEIVNIQLKPHTKLRKLNFDMDFAEIAIKGRASQGNIVSKYPVKKISFKSSGVSTLAGRKIWYDTIMKRLNADERGQYLGEFDGDDKILVVLSDGSYELSNFDLSNHFDEKMIRIEKYHPDHIYTVVHQDGKSGTYFVKRFKFDDQPIGKRISFINEDAGSKLVLMSNAAEPMVKLEILKGKSQTEETLDQPLTEIIDVKGIKAQGNRLSFHTVKSVTLTTADEDLSQKGKEKAAETSTDTTETTVDSTITAEDGSVKEKEVESTDKNDDIKLEITNPNDIQIDDKGQMEMF